MKRTEKKGLGILDDVQKTVGQRQQDYNSFPETMKLTADIASKVLGKDISAVDVCLIYAINKLVRSRGRMKRDNILDGIAYLAVIDDITDLEP